MLSEVGPSSPAALQAVRALALHAKGQRAEALDAVAGWLSDPACASNPSVLLVAGLLYALEENYVEALRVCHTGGSLEMWVLGRRGGRVRGWRGRQADACSPPCLACTACLACDWPVVRACHACLRKVSSLLQDAAERAAATSYHPP